MELLNECPLSTPTKDDLAVSIGVLGSPGSIATVDGQGHAGDP